jgi:predicted DNA-binding protein with PD1-like motif
MAKKIALLFGLLSFSLVGNAAVGDHTCRMLGDNNAPFILSMKTGDDFVEVINMCVSAADIQNVMVSGLGALKDVQLGYYNSATQKYENKTFSGELEIVALTGNIKRSEDDSVKPHLHVVLANEKYEVLGGHLQSAKVASGAEVNIIPAQDQIIEHHIIE